MDEQLEHAIEGNGIEAAVHEETAVQIPSPDPTPEEATQTGGEEVDERPQAPCKRATGWSPALGESLQYTRKQLYRFHPRTPPRKKQQKTVGKKK